MSRQDVRRHAPGRLLGAAGVALASLQLCGCANFWDDVTSRDFHVASLWVKPNPLEVLRDSTDGDKRARALRELREPKQHGGTDQEQDVVIDILVTTAKSDPQPLCRLAAIQTLGDFKDTRAVQGLIGAFWAVAEEPRSKRPPSRFDSAAQAKVLPPDTVAVIQCEAVRALGQTRNPAAVELLAQVARPEPGTSEGVSVVEQQEIRDVKIAAVRALANFGHYQSTEALLVVLQKERDVALRNRAVESLQTATGKKLGDDPKAWEEVLHQAPAAGGSGSGTTTVEGREPGADPKKIKRVSGTAEQP